MVIPIFKEVEEGGKALPDNADTSEIIKAYRALSMHFATLATECLEELKKTNLLVAELITERRNTNIELRLLKDLVVKHGIAPAGSL